MPRTHEVKPLLGEPSEVDLVARIDAVESEWVGHGGRA